MIWQVPMNTAELNKRGENTLASYLGILFTGFTDDTLTATMPVEQRVKQPLGIMHGGASCVLAETVGSTAANCSVDLTKEYCVGLDINTNHVRAVRSGLLTAISKPYHIGRTTQVWSIEIYNEAQKLISINRLTMAVLQRNAEKNTGY